MAIEPIKYSFLTKHFFSLKGLGLILVLAAVNALFWGAYPISLSELKDVLRGDQTETLQYLIWEIRIPRILLALATGAILAVTGTSLQALFRNPLADPMILGVTFGAMLFAVAGIVLSYTIFSWLPIFLQQAGVSLLAFAGSLLFTVWVYLLSTKGSHTSVATMLLAGIALGSIASAITGLFTYFSSETQLRDITFWTMGSLTQANWRVLALFLPIGLDVTVLLLHETPAIAYFKPRSTCTKGKKNHHHRHCVGGGCQCSDNRGDWICWIGDPPFVAPGKGFGLSLLTTCCCSWRSILPGACRYPGANHHCSCRTSHWDIELTHWKSLFPLAPAQATKKPSYLLNANTHVSNKKYLL